MAQTKLGAAKTAAKYYGLTLEEYFKKLQTKKACKQCKKWKPRDEFCKDKSSVDGLGKACLVCRRVKDKKCTKGRTTWMKGKKHTEETKAKMRSSWRKQDKPRLNLHRIGAKHTEETKRKLSEIHKKIARRGPASPFWKGGIADKNKAVRASDEYKKWRQQVFARDKYTCQNCGDKRGGNLNAHHIKDFAKHPELRFDVNNGITYCEDCHCQVHHKPYSIRNKRKRKQKTVGIVGFYKITTLGKDYLAWELPPLELLADGLTKCACGCGAKFMYLDSGGRPRRFLSGHNARRGTTRNLILRFLLDNGDKRLADIKAEITPAAIKTALSKMRKQGLVEHVKLVN